MPPKVRDNRALVLDGLVPVLALSDPWANFFNCLSFSSCLIIVPTSQRNPVRFK